MRRTPTNQATASATMALSGLRRSLEEAPIVDRAGYPYFVHPITDGVPRLEAALLREVVETLAQRLPDEFDVILAAEAMGIHLAAALGLASGKPVVVARKRAYGLPGETPVDQATGYGTAVLHVNDIRPGERVVIVDDVVSTSGTLRALASALDRIGARLVKVLVVLNKDHDLDALSQTIGAPVEALLRVRVAGGRVQVVD